MYHVELPKHLGVAAAAQRLALVHNQAAEDDLMDEFGRRADTGEGVVKAATVGTEKVPACGGGRGCHNCTLWTRVKQFCWSLVIPVQGLRGWAWVLKGQKARRFTKKLLIFLLEF